MFAISQNDDSHKYFSAKVEKLQWLQCDAFKQFIFSFFQILATDVVFDSAK